MINFSGKTVQEAANILLVDLPYYPGNDLELQQEIADTRQEIERKRRILAQTPCRDSMLAPTYAHMLGLRTSYLDMEFTTEEEYRKCLFDYQLTLTTFTLLITFKNRADN